MSCFSSLIGDIGLVAAAFTIWKVIKRTRWVHLRDVPLQEILDAADRNPEELDGPTQGWLRLVSWMWD